MGQVPEDSLFYFPNYNKISLLFDLALTESMRSYNPHSKIFSNIHTISAFMSYPLLEGLLKILSNDDINLDGTIKRNNRVQKVSSGGGFYQAGDECSNLVDLLVHYEENLATNVVASVLEEMREELTIFGDKPKNLTYSLISSWRNAALHGELKHDFQYGIILNVICILIWGEINSRMTNREDRN
jgi:hypothetical protein